jgi:hypothetical protein
MYCLSDELYHIYHIILYYIISFYVIIWATAGSLASPGASPMKYIVLYCIVLYNVLLYIIWATAGSLALPGPGIGTRSAAGPGPSCRCLAIMSYLYHIAYFIYLFFFFAITAYFILLHTSLRCMYCVCAGACVHARRVRRYMVVGIRACAPTCTLCVYVCVMYVHASVHSTVSTIVEGRGERERESPQ